MAHDWASKPTADDISKARIDLPDEQARRSGIFPFLAPAAQAALPPWLTPFTLKEMMPVPVIGRADKSC